jgi:hypothetical protein
MPDAPLLGGLPATGLRLFDAEFGITVINGDVWLSIGIALLFGAGILLFGIWAARTVGFLERDAPPGEMLGVGLASGLMVLAAWWAAIWSGGRSSFTPVAIGFVIAIAVAVARRDRGQAAVGEPDLEGSNDETTATSWSQNVPLARTALAGGLFIVAVALLYGSTMAPSPRDHLQPVEFSDEAFYSILGRDLATTGTETNLSSSGFSSLPGLPSQTWYHWGELWLASAVITMFGTAPLAARCLIVLPIVLLAAAALSGTLVRRMTKTRSRQAYVFGFLACLFLAPLPVPGPFFSSWASGLISGINQYGLSAVSALIALYSVQVIASRHANWALAVYVGSAVAFILPAHIAIAALALVGAGAVWAILIGQSLVETRRLPNVPLIWRRALTASAVGLVATVAWGLFTGHGLGGSASAPNVVAPFNSIWQFSVAFTYLGAGTFLAIPVAALLFE